MRDRPSSAGAAAPDRDEAGPGAGWPGAVGQSPAPPARGPREDSAATLVIACGALARELVSLVRINDWPHLKVTCLPAILHNRPQKIPAAVRGKIRQGRAAGHRRILVLYGDCGTGGELDRVLAEEGAERIAGPHCYEFFAGTDVFAGLVEEEIGTFFLTDYLVRQFDRLIWEGLGLDRHPELMPLYFEHYRRVVYLAQVADGRLIEKAKAAAARLGLPLEVRVTGLGGLARFLDQAAPGEGRNHGPADDRLLA